MNDSIKSTIFRMMPATFIRDVRIQFMCPTKSFLGYIVSKEEAKQTKPIYKALINRMNIQPDDNILEIGFGLGAGLEIAMERLQGGQGIVCGTELSNYMRDIVKAELLPYIDKKISISQINSLYSFLPFISNYFDSIYHVDVFYAWNKREMHDICDELFRVLRPGKSMFCAMEMERLKRLTKWRIMKRFDYSVSRYFDALEASGFPSDGIQADYISIDPKGNECEKEKPNAREILVISAQKPKDAGERNADEMWKKLEADVKEVEAENAIVRGKLGTSKKAVEELAEMKMKEEPPNL